MKFFAFRICLGCFVFVSASFQFLYFSILVLVTVNEFAVFCYWHFSFSLTKITLLNTNSHIVAGVYKRVKSMVQKTSSRGMIQQSGLTI